MSSKSYIKVSSYLFLIIALVHGLRLLQGWRVVVNGMDIGISWSFVALIITGYLAYQGFKHSKK